MVRSLPGPPLSLRYPPTSPVRGKLAAGIIPAVIEARPRGKPRAPPVHARRTHRSPLPLVAPAARQRATTATSWGLHHIFWLAWPLRPLRAVRPARESDSPSLSSPSLHRLDSVNLYLFFLLIDSVNPSQSPLYNSDLQNSDLEACLKVRNSDLEATGRNTCSRCASGPHDRVGHREIRRVLPV